MCVKHKTSALGGSLEKAETDSSLVGLYLAALKDGLEGWVEFELSDKVGKNIFRGRNR